MKREFHSFIQQLHGTFPILTVVVLNSTELGHKGQEPSWLACFIIFWVPLFLEGGVEVEVAAKDLKTEKYRRNGTKSSINIL